MKKILVATTALVGAMTIANVASAQNAPELKVGMDMRVWAFMTNDDSQGVDNGDMRLDVRLPITVTGKTDSGLTYGGYVRLRTSAAPGYSTALPQTPATREAMQHDYGFIHIGGAFGKLEFGDNDGPLTVTYVAAPLVGSLQINAAGNGIPTALGSYGGLGNFNYGSALYLDQSTRVNYYTPVFAGFQGAIGFAPELGSRGLDVQVNETIPAVKNEIEAAVVWNGKFDPVTVKASVGYATGESQTPLAPAVAVNDVSVWQAGVNLGFGAFTVGAGYFNNSDSRWTVGNGIDDEYGWNIGGSWKQGALSVAAVYGRTSTQYTAVSGIADTDDTMYGVGASYALAPGLYLDADFLMFDLESVTPANNDGAVGGAPAKGNEGNALIARTRILL